MDETCLQAIFAELGFMVVAEIKWRVQASDKRHLTAATGMYVDHPRPA
jgi:hypothetical protein